MSTTEEIRRRLLESGMRDRPDGRHFDREGKAISPIDWVILYEDNDYRRVAFTGLAGGGHISTVWLGLDHGFYGGPRQIFETMDSPKQEICERYATLADALAGHDEVVARVLQSRGLLS